jgi:hypothetical protein
MSTHRALAQRPTNAFSVISTVNIYSLADMTSRLLANGATKVSDSVFTIPVATGGSPSLAAAVAAYTFVAQPAAGTTLIDLGKTITVQVVGSTDGACYMKFREVKQVTSTTGGLSGYVVVENNYGLASGANGKVAVARA